MVSVTGPESLLPVGHQSGDGPQGTWTRLDTQAPLEARTPLLPSPVPTSFTWTWGAPSPSQHRPGLHLLYPPSSSRLSRGPVVDMLDQFHS